MPVKKGKVKEIKKPNITKQGKGIGERDVVFVSVSAGSAFTFEALRDWRVVILRLLPAFVDEDLRERLGERMKRKVQND
jgi:hypothetical protein